MANTTTTDEASEKYVLISARPRCAPSTGTALKLGQYMNRNTVPALAHTHDKRFAGHMLSNSSAMLTVHFGC